MIIIRMMIILKIFNNIKKNKNAKESGKKPKNAKASETPTKLRPNSLRNKLKSKGCRQKIP
jgi:hypothetical protein